MVVFHPLITSQLTNITIVDDDGKSHDIENGLIYNVCIMPSLKTAPVSTLSGMILYPFEVKAKVKPVWNNIPEHLKKYVDSFSVNGWFVSKFVIHMYEGDYKYAVNNTHEFIVDEILSRYRDYKAFIEEDLDDPIV